MVKNNRKYSGAGGTGQGADHRNVPQVSPHGYCLVSESNQNWLKVTRKCVLGIVSRVKYRSFQGYIIYHLR